MTVEETDIIAEHPKEGKKEHVSNPRIHGHDGAEIHGVHVLIRASHYLPHNQSVSLL